MGQHTLFKVSDLVNAKFSWEVPSVKCKLTKCKITNAVCSFRSPLCIHDSKPIDKGCVF